MNRSRFQAITALYPKLRVGLIGDFCLDRYLEIDPAKQEISIETGLPVHNVVRVRAQPGGAGTILNNLVALGIGTIYPVGFAGIDGEGFELRQALAAKPGVKLDFWLETPLRRTFTYCKPLVLEPGKPPVELNRLDSKNWTATPDALQEQLAEAVRRLAPQVDAFILLSQVDLPGTGVITTELLKTIEGVATANTKLLMLADSRTGLQGYPSVCLKMNRAELARMMGTDPKLGVEELKASAQGLAQRHGRMVFITLAEEGIVGATPKGEVRHVPAWPLRGPIDIVGAGDSVTANLVAALAGGANLQETIELASAAASIVIHQLGTTGAASVPEIAALFQSPLSLSPRAGQAK